MANILMLAAFAMDKHDAELIHFSSITNGLKKLGYEVSVYHLSKTDEPAIRDILQDDIPFTESFINATSNNEMFIKGVLAFPSFLKFLFKNKPDIIYSRLGIVTGIYIISAKLLFRKKIITITEHNGWIGPEAKATGKSAILVCIGEMIQKWGARFSDSIRAVSQGIKDYLVSMNINCRKIYIIGNGTDINNFYPSNSKITYDFGFIGNLAKWQGVDVLIDSFSLLHKKFPAQKIAIAGSGPLLNYFSDKILALGIQKNVNLVGSIPYNRANSFINSCRICVSPKLNFIHPSKNNVSFSYSPLKIRDYAACGKPIISSRIPGLEEIEDAGFGILVEPGNVEALKEAMLSLLKDPQKVTRMSVKAREYAERNYSWEIIAKRISGEIILPLIKEIP